QQPTVSITAVAETKSRWCVYKLGEIAAIGCQSVTEAIVEFLQLRRAVLECGNPSKLLRDLPANKCGFVGIEICRRNVCQGNENRSARRIFNVAVHPLRTSVQFTGGAVDELLVEISVRVPRENGEKVIEQHSFR